MKIIILIALSLFLISCAAKVNRPGAITIKENKDGFHLHLKNKEFANLYRHSYGLEGIYSTEAQDLIEYPLFKHIKTYAFKEVQVIPQRNKTAGFEIPLDEKNKMQCVVNVNKKVFKTKIKKAIKHYTRQGYKLTGPIKVINAKDEKSIESFVFNKYSKTKFHAVVFKIRMKNFKNNKNLKSLMCMHIGDGMRVTFDTIFNKITSQL